MSIATVYYMNPMAVEEINNSLKIQCYKPISKGFGMPNRLRSVKSVCYHNLFRTVFCAGKSYAGYLLIIDCLPKHIKVQSGVNNSDDSRLPDVRELTTPEVPMSCLQTVNEDIIVVRVFGFAGAKYNKSVARLPWLISRLLASANVNDHPTSTGVANGWHEDLHKPFRKPYVTYGFRNRISLLKAPRLHHDVGEQQSHTLYRNCIRYAVSDYDIDFLLIVYETNQIATDVARSELEKHRIETGLYGLCFQQIKPNNYLMRRQFCEQMIVNLNEDDNSIDELRMSDEAHFHFNGFLNKQNVRYWVPDNPHQLH
ncbi:hypothetical protein ANN_16606 [Periplaneta americana]|uniref:Hexosyltransferase n=1 Tax=Periplaneta americana TaxID=6978 RepID=A0ABQ8SQU7_PERAM|nr:hypothetical protein ANN_16606 [Periplaneta americana]